MHVNYCNFILNYLLTEILVDYYSDVMYIVKINVMHCMFYL